MEQSENLYLAPVTLRQANDFAAKHRKNFRSVPQDKFSIGCAAEGKLVGVVMVGYPRDPKLNDGQTLAVHHICATGGRTAYGMLYGAAARAAKAMGYCRIIAFLPENISSSGLRAAGWRCTGPAEGSRPQAPKKLRYEQRLMVRHRKVEELSI